MPLRQYYQDEITRAGELGPLLTGILDEQKKMTDKLDLHDIQLASHSERLSDLATAFPNTDTEGHRRYHQTMIEILEERRRLRVAVQEKTISGLLWAVLVFLGLAAWQYVKIHLER